MDLGLILERNLEEALDAAKIAIVPIPAKMKKGEKTEWKIVVTDPTVLNHQATGLGNAVVKWKVHLSRPNVSLVRSPLTHF